MKVTFEANVPYDLIAQDHVPESPNASMARALGEAGLAHRDYMVALAQQLREHMRGKQPMMLQGETREMMADILAVIRNYPISVVGVPTVVFDRDIRTHQFRYLVRVEILTAEFGHVEVRRQDVAGYTPQQQFARIRRSYRVGEDEMPLPRGAVAATTPSPTAPAATPTPFPAAKSPRRLNLRRS